MSSFGDTLSSTYSQFNQIITPSVISILVPLSIPLLFLILLAIFWPLWVTYVRRKNFLSLKYTLLEIKLPKDTFKSPLAMELLFHGFHNTADGGWLNQFWKGETRPWYSLELISIEGRVKFYLWTEDRRKVGAMSALYAQFPGIEVREVEDYAKSVHYDPETMRIWAAEFKLTKDDPYPIKTYIDYGLDKDPKEEFKVDPMVPGIEFLGNIGPNQQVWIQILIRAHKEEQRKPGHIFKKTDAWKDKAGEEIDKIMRRDSKTKIAGIKDPVSGRVTPPTLGEHEKDIVSALGRSITKLPFDVGIRTLYITKKEVFDGPFGIGGIISFFKHFNSESLNGFKPNGDKWSVYLDAPWKDWKNIRRDRYSREGLSCYKMRSYFYTPAGAVPFILNTEELATIFHFPGSVSLTPGLERVPSKKGEAPANLPIYIAEKEEAPGNLPV